MHQIAPHARDEAHRLGTRFATARPFRHLQIDDFFEPGYAHALLEHFPPFERGNARNEDGQLGGKSTIERIRDLAPAFAELDDLVQSRRFLGWLSEATGIPDLRYDPHYFGGGTHENRHGQDLDPHIDFNRHPVSGWHRRLNLIVYLNPAWEAAWGGLLELHSDPRSEDDQITLIAPTFNRCVIFETTESSWHGFNQITLPEQRRDLSRRSVALYFYTMGRPAEETGPVHSTIYVDRPLPDRFAAGYVLDEADVRELKILMARRDQHNQRLYGELIKAQATLPHSPLRDEPGPLASVLRAAAGLCRYGLSRRDADAQRQFKHACQPLARRMPTALRERLRHAWRARHPE